MFASKDAEIADLKARLKEALKNHEPCPALIDSLRKQVAGLELSRDYAKVTRMCCELVVGELKSLYDWKAYVTD